MASCTPDRRAFTYSFARFAGLMDGLLDQLGVERIAALMLDFLDRKLSRK